MENYFKLETTKPKKSKPPSKLTYLSKKSRYRFQTHDSNPPTPTKKIELVFKPFIFFYRMYNNLLYYYYYYITYYISVFL